MAVTTQTKSTSRFIEATPYLCALTVLIVMIAACLSLAFSRTLLSSNVQVEPDEPVELKTVEIKPQLFGAWRIDVKASIPRNRWLTYELQLLDEQGNLVASALKEAWNESGTWQEDGESGTWQEDDLMAGLDVRSTEGKSEKLTIALAVLDYTDTSGTEIDQPVNFKVTIKTGAIDSRYLWAGFFGTIALTILSLMAVANSGKTAIGKWIGDSDVGERGIVGGADNLVELTVDVKADETCPEKLNVNLWVYDGYGEEIYTCVLPMTVTYTKDEGTIESAKGKVNKYFVLERRGSYRFYVEVTPDQPVDRTDIIVKEKVSTICDVEVVQVSEPISDR